LRITAPFFKSRSVVVFGYLVKRRRESVMPSSDLAEVERRIRNVSCPVCSSGKVELSGGRALCRLCGFTFGVETDRALLYREEPGLADRLKKAECPDCGERAGEPVCRCDLASGDSFYILGCLSCGFTYKERAEIKKPRR
jgi:transcription elongation factor Elf1